MECDKSHSVGNGTFVLVSLSCRFSSFMVFKIYDLCMNSLIIPSDSQSG